MDALVGCGFRLVVDDPQLVPDRGILESTGIVPVVLGGAGADGFVRTGGPDAAGWLLGRGVHAAVVRPDHYVYGTAVERAGVQVLLDDLQRALHVPRG
jgi:3-(3-hydroxy-phenyl)propionate hydroxylase